MSDRRASAKLLVGVLLMAGTAFADPPVASASPAALPLVLTGPDTLQPFNARTQLVPREGEKGRDCLAITGLSPGLWGLTSRTAPAPVLLGTVTLDVHVPDDAPPDLDISVFLKDKDGIWFQCRVDGSLRRGVWQTVEFDVSPASAHVQPVGHRAAWNCYYSGHTTEIGIGLFSAGETAVRILVDHLAVTPFAPTPAPIQVYALRVLTPTPKAYERCELAFNLSQPVANPFDSQQIAVDAVFRTPSGRTMAVPAFYYQPYARLLGTDQVETVSPDGPASWRVRFTPLETGKHTWKLTITAGTQRLETKEHSLVVAQGEPHGFVRVSQSDPRYFETADGSFFYPIGQNIHAPFDRRGAKMLGVPILPNRGTFAYDHYFEKMAANGENAVIVWMSNWWVSVEWSRDWQGFNGLSDYNLGNAWRLDLLLDAAQAHGIHVLLVLDNHGKLSKYVDSEWDSNPYNARNGGPCARPEDFLLGAKPFDIYRKRLRYIVARWGSHPNLLGFEVVSELNLVGTSPAFRGDPSHRAWCRRVVEYLNEADAYHRPVTVQYSNDWRTVDEKVASMPGLSFLVGDAYKAGGEIAPLIVETADRNGRFGKPTFSAEFGGNWNGTTPARLHADLHTGLWANCMTGSAGAPFFWWFDFVDKFDLYGEYRALAAFMKGEDRRGAGLTTMVLPVRETNDGRVTLAALAGVVATGDRAMLWVYDTFAAEVMPEERFARLQTGAVVTVPGLAPGLYEIELWDTFRGTVTKRETVAANAAGLTVSLPDFKIDVAAKLRRVRNE